MKRFRVRQVRRVIVTLDIEANDPLEALEKFSARNLPLPPGIVFDDTYVRQARVILDEGEPR